MRKSWHRPWAAARARRPAVSPSPSHGCETRTIFRYYRATSMTLTRYSSRMHTLSINLNDSYASVWQLPAALPGRTGRSTDIRVAWNVLLLPVSAACPVTFATKQMTNLRVPLQRPGRDDHRVRSNGRLGSESMRYETFVISARDLKHKYTPQGVKLLSSATTGQVAGTGRGDRQQHSG